MMKVYKAINTFSELQSIQGNPKYIKEVQDYPGLDYNAIKDCVLQALKNSDKIKEIKIIGTCSIDRLDQVEFNQFKIPFIINQTTINNIKTNKYDTRN